MVEASILKSDCNNELCIGYSHNAVFVILETTKKNKIMQFKNNNNERLVYFLFLVLVRKLCGDMEEKLNTYTSKRSIKALNIATQSLS